MKKKEAQRVTLFVIMLVLTFITFSIFTPALTGYFVAGEAEWENRLLETVMSSTDTITVTIEFGEYKPDKCSEGVYVETQYGDKIEFMVIEEIYEDDKCNRCTVSFDNVIYIAEEEVEPKPPTSTELPPLTTLPPEGEFISPDNITEPKEEDIANQSLAEPTDVEIPESKPPEEEESEELPSPLTAFVAAEQEITYYVYYGKLPEEAVNITEEQPPELPPLRTMFGENWWNTSFARRKEINISSSAALTNFPVFLNVTHNASTMQADYDDIRFINGSCSSAETLELDYEFVENDSNAGEFWVKIPTLVSGTTSICMYYNNSQVSSGENASGVWSNNYVLVTHMKDNDSSSVLDSTQYSNNGTKGASEKPNETTGRIYHAQDFNSTSTDYINFGHDDEFDITTAITFEAWTKPASVMGSADILGKKYTWILQHTNNHFYLRMDNTTDTAHYARLYDWLDSSKVDTWHYLVGTWSKDVDSGFIKLYVNGSEVAYDWQDAITDGLQIDDDRSVRAGYYVNPYNGTLDEVRLSNVTRSSDWINMTYQVVQNQGSVVTWGGEEKNPPTVPSNIQCNGNDNCNILVDTEVTLNCSGSTDAESDAITYFLEAGLQNITEIQNTTNVSMIGEFIEGCSATTIWTKEAGAGCGSGWTGPSSWEMAEFRVFVNDLSNTSNFDEIRLQFCAGSDEILRVNNVSICWINNDTPDESDTCTDDLVQIDGEGTADGWIYSQIAAGECEYTPWFTYDFNGSRNYFVQWGTLTGDYGGNTYKSGCSDAEDSRIQNDNSHVMNPSWTSDAWDNYMYDFAEIQGNCTNTASEEANSSYTVYDGVGSDFKTINNITIKVEVDSYNPSASVDQSTNNPDLELDIYNSTDWVTIGEFDLNESYTGDSLNITNANFSLTTTDSSVLTAWQDSSNQSFRIRGRYIDNNVSVADEINYTNVWATINGKKYIEIGNHSESATLDWNTTDLDEQTGIDLRCRAIDLAGSNTYSNYFTKGCFLNISHVPTDYPLFANYYVNETLIGNGSYARFNLTVNDTSDSISYVNGTINSTHKIFSNTSGTHWYYDYLCNSSGTIIWSHVSANDSLDNWNNTAVSNINFTCDAGFPQFSSPAINETLIFPNEYFCINITITDAGIANISTVYGEIYNVTSSAWENVTMSNSTSVCGGGGDVWEATVQGVTTGYWNYSKVWANDSVNNINVTDFTDLSVNAIYPKINIDWIYPTSNINAIQYQFFNVTVNVTCLSNDCGTINTSLDPANWWNTSFAKRKEINISNSGSALTNFPVFLNITHNASTMQADYDDIRFINGSCPSAETLELDYEFVENDSNAAEFWVKIPTLASGTTSICMYYNNSQVSSAENPTGVWSNNYSMVQHMNDNNDTTINGSTSNHHVGTKNTTSKQPIEIGGIIQHAQNFTHKPSGSYITIPDDSSINLPDASWTISFWYYQDSMVGDTYQYVYSTGNYATNGAINIWKTVGAAAWTSISADDVGGTFALTANAHAPDSNWHYVVYRRLDGDLIRIFYDGVSDDSDPIDFSSFSNPSDVYLGCRADINVDRFFGGRLDEVRIINTSRSSDWINMSYQIVTNQTGVVTWGGEEDSGEKGLISAIAGATPFYTNVSNPNSTSFNENDSYTITWWVNATGSINDIYEFFAYANQTSNISNSNSTSKLNVTIIELVNYPQFFDFHVNETLIGNGSYAKFNLTVNDTSDSISYVNGTINSTHKIFSNTSGTHWYYDYLCNSSGTIIWSHVSANDSLDNWNNTAVSNINFTCDAGFPQFSSPAINETLIFPNEYFCINITITDAGIANISTVYGEIYNVTSSAWENVTMSNSTSVCGGGGDVWEATVQGVTTGYWNYSKVWANDTSNNANSTDFADLNVSVGMLTDCTALSKAGTYYLTKDISNSPEVDCINITANDIIFDCQDYTIDGQDNNPSKGIFVCRSSDQNTNITIQNCDLTDWRRSILLKNSDQNIVRNITSTTSSIGILLDNSANNVISNISSADTFGIDIGTDSDNNNITNLTTTGSSYGIVIRGSDNIITNVTTNSNTQYGIYLTSGSDNKIENSSLINSGNYDLWISTAVCNNQIKNVIGTDNKPIIFFNNTVTLEHWNNNVSELILCNADNSVLNNITINHVDVENNALYVVNTDHSTLKNIDITGFEYCIEVRSSTNNTFANITTDSNVYGLFLYASAGNRISDLTATNGNTGLLFYSSSNNNNATDIISADNSVGLYISSSSNNTINDSEIRDSSNTGIYLADAGNEGANSLYNNLFNNSVQFKFSGTNYTNYWNTTQRAGTRIFSSGIDIGGNYLTNSSGTDYSDTCDDVDYNGFCDDQYNISIDLLNVDYLPLSNKYDADVPIFSNPAVNNTSINVNNYFCINITITDSGPAYIDTAYAEIYNTTDWINITLTNATSYCGGGGDVWEASIQATIVGEWNYSKVWANDTANNANSTDFADLSVTAVNNAPTIDDISNIATQTVLAGTVRQVTFYVLVNDTQGYNDIDNVNASFNKVGEADRTNSSCVFVNNTSLIQGNYSCVIGIWYWDESGTWNVNATVNDTQNAVSALYNETFLLQETTSFVMSPGLIEFPVALPGQTNVTYSPTILNNTANKGIAEGNINMTAINLVGEEDSNYWIDASNFTVYNATGGAPPIECGGSQMLNDTYITITGTLLPTGNLSAGEAQERFYYCLIETSRNLTGQAYSTNIGGQWILQIT